MRRAIALIAGALLVLALAGPVTADPVDKSQFTHVYLTDCSADPDAPVVPPQMAHAVPGWDLYDWQPGDTPWLLMGFVIHYSETSEAVAELPPGLVGNGKLFGPCTITWDPLHPYPDISYPYISDAYYMQR